MEEIQTFGVTATGETLIACAVCDGKGKRCEACGGAGLIAIKTSKEA